MFSNSVNEPKELGCHREISKKKNLKNFHVKDKLTKDIRVNKKQIKIY